MAHLTPAENRVFASHLNQTTKGDAFRIIKTTNTPGQKILTKEEHFVSTSTGWDDIQNPAPFLPATLFSKGAASTIVNQLSAIGESQPPMVTYDFRSP